MAKVAIKYDNIIPYGGIFYAMNDFFHVDSADDRWRAARCLVGFRAARRGYCRCVTTVTQQWNSRRTAVDQLSHNNRPTVAQDAQAMAK